LNSPHTTLDCPGGQVPLQVVPSYNVLDLVDHPGACLPGFFAKRGQAPILLIGTGGDVHLAYTAFL